MAKIRFVLALVPLFAAFLFAEENACQWVDRLERDWMMPGPYSADSILKNARAEVLTGACGEHVTCRWYNDADAIDANSQYAHLIEAARDIEIRGGCPGAAGEVAQNSNSRGRKVRSKRPSSSRYDASQDFFQSRLFAEIAGHRFKYNVMDTFDILGSRTSVNILAGLGLGFELNPNEHITLGLGYVFRMYEQVYKDFDGSEFELYLFRDDLSLIFAFGLADVKFYVRPMFSFGLFDHHANQTKRHVHFDAKGHSFGGELGFRLKQSHDIYFGFMDPQVERMTFVKKFMKSMYIGYRFNFSFYSIE